MSERQQYPAGVPCWVETLQPDPQAARVFYGGLFGWEFTAAAPMPGDPPGQYFVARVNGRDVAGIGSLNPRGGPFPPTWITQVRVDSVDQSVDRVTNAGGSVRDGPIDSDPAGRSALIADPAGALFCVWEARTREGAQLVNEPRTWALSVLRTKDLDGAEAFYGAVFGWQPKQFGGPNSQFTIWRLPGYVGGEPQQPVPRDVVGGMTPIRVDRFPSAEQPRWTVEFWVDDADATADHATSLGGKVIVSPYDTPGFRNAVLMDPQGAEFSISTLTAGP